ncbi:hypothetical protein Ahy_B02g058403 [Arachis hypogaea]|uniref:Uncharacterized protein n=1 Tax=Arachis hypogaea TaxID=3818 RepID=A0A445AEK0_ARAHY|nr:hypothetical protein Ahy_B02g058403 [Arachis hypogaea]
MATIHITLCINHRGRFERGPSGKLTYVDGEVTEIERVNVDTLNDFFVSDLVKDIGYTSVSKFFWLEPGKGLDDGLRDLKVDMDIVRMYEAAVKNSNRVNVYTEHPVDEPVLVEENNMTPSKRRVKRCAKKVPTPKNSPKRRLIVVEDEDDADIVSNLHVGMDDRKRSEAQSREEAYEAHTQADLDAQKEDNITMEEETADPQLSGSVEAGKVSQPPPTPGIPDKPPSSQSQPSQPPIEQDQQPTHTACSDSVPASEPNVSAPLEPEQLTQYTPHPYGNPLSQSIPQTVPPSDTNRTPQNDQSNPSEEVQGRPKSFIPNPDPDKPPTFYVPVDDDDFSDENPGHHCYESEELHSIASDDDTEQTPVFPQSNPDAPVNQVQLEVGMEFETLSHFRKAVRKFNINIGRSIFFARCDSTRSKAICYDEECPWQIYCAKRTFPASFQVKTFVNEHTCSRDNRCKSANGKWVIDELEERIRVQPNLTITMRPVPSQEYWEHDVDTLPILPPRYRKPIGRPTLKRDKRNDGPKEKSDPHRTSRRIGTIICKYCLQAGHNKRSCKKRKEAVGEGSSAPQAPADDEDEDLLAEMYYDETLESAQAEQEATEERNESARTNTQQPQPTNATTRKQVKRRSVKRPPPTGQRQQPSTPATNQPATTPSTHNSQTTPHPLQGASAGTSTRFMQFIPTPGVVTPTATGPGTSDRGRGQGRGRDRIRGSSGGKNGLSSGSSYTCEIHNSYNKDLSFYKSYDFITKYNSQNRQNATPSATISPLNSESIHHQVLHNNARTSSLLNILPRPPILVRVHPPKQIICNLLSKRKKIPNLSTKTQKSLSNLNNNSSCPLPPIEDI